MTGLRTRLPITLRAPLLVALLMIAVSVVVSERVMRRLIETQERQLVELSSAYLDGLTSSLTPHILRADVWEVYDALERSKELYSAARPIETVVIGRSEMVLASSDPLRIPSLEPISAELREPLAEADFAIDEERGRAFIRREVRYQGVAIGGVYAVLDISHLLQERSDVIMTLLATNGVLTLGLAALGYALVQRMVTPVRILTSHLCRGVDGKAEPIAEGRMPSHGSETRELFDAYNRLVEAENQRGALAQRLAHEEKLYSLGRLASGMAHEINNPLGGLFNALHVMKRYGDRGEARAASIDLIERGLIGIRDVVKAALATYRPDNSRRSLEREDIEDIRVLAHAEIKRNGVRLDWRNALTAKVETPAAPVRQIILNLLLNACAAAREETGLNVVTRRCGRGAEATLIIVVEDDGQGLPEGAARILEKPDAAPPIGEGGLGLWMVRRLTTELGGEISHAPRPAGGTRIEVALPIGKRMETAEVAHAGV